jgi:hypothetical protein
MLAADAVNKAEVHCPLSTVALEQAFDALLRGDVGDLDAYLCLVDKHLRVGGLQVSVHCHGLYCNQNGARVSDLARMVAARILDYAIPRSQFAEAKRRDALENTDRFSNELRMKARELFTNLEKSGEGGEMLLYLLLQTYLRVPQLLCKMTLKTSGQVHVHGVDGVHVDVDRKSGALRLYWGESKLYGSIGSALKNSLAGLRKYLTDAGGSGSPLERDLFLLRDYLDLDDPILEDAVLTLLDRDNPVFNNIEYRGAALVGFDCRKYPTKPNQIDNAAVQAALKAELPKWLKQVRSSLKQEQILSSYSIDIFLVPFPTVASFRKAFAQEIL